MSELVDKIFVIDNNQVTVSVDCLLIPQLKAVVDKYDDHIQALTYCAYMVSPQSPYSDLEKDLKEETLLSDYPGSYKVTDIEICQAIDKLEDLYPSTTTNYFKSTKILVDKLGVYSRTVIIDDSRETGNIQHVLKIVEKCGKTISEFRILEAAKNEELKTRGNHQLGYDQIKQRL